ncbi:pirin family protein [Streptomyces hirsutus]
MRGDHVSNMIQLFWNWIGRTQEEIEQARRDWMEGTRFGEVKGYDGAPLPAPELPPVPLKPRGRVR